MYEREHMRTWQDRGFRVELYDTHEREPITGKNIVEFELFDEQIDHTVPMLGPIQLPVPRNVAVDADEVIRSAIHWYETDFPSPTERQQQWLDSQRVAQLTELFYEMSDEAGPVYWEAYHAANSTDTD